MESWKKIRCILYKLYFMNNKEAKETECKIFLKHI